MHRTLLLLVLLALTGTSLATAKDFPGIRQLMTEEEYREAGLHKLSPGEREALNRWLIGYTVEDAVSLRNNNETVRQAEQDIRIEASLEGPFNGWSGDTLFRLDNGQVWRQRLDGRFSYSGNDRRVVIEKNFFGFFKLTHLASGRAVGVTRID